MQEEFSDAVNGRLKAAREESGLTLAEVALKTGYAITTLSSVENGHDAPSKRLVEKVVEVLGINPAWLDTGKGNMFLQHVKIKYYHIIPEEQLSRAKEAAELMRLRAGDLIRQAETLEEEITDSADHHANSFQMTRVEYEAWMKAGKPPLSLYPEMKARWEKHMQKKSGRKGAAPGKKTV